MTGEANKPDGTFGSFLEMVKNEPSFPATAEQANAPSEQSSTSNELEEAIIEVLTLLKLENGGPISLEDLYKKCDLRLRLFGEAVTLMSRQGLVVIQADDQVSLAPGIQEQL